MNTFAIWFRLFVTNACCRGLSNLTMFVSFAIPITWIFTFVPVCRVAAETGATGYWWQLGAIVAYSAVCFAAWAAVFFPCLTVRACADCDCCDFRPVKPEPAAPEPKSSRKSKVPPTPEHTPVEPTLAPSIVASNDIKKSCLNEDCMCGVTSLYSLMLIAAAPIALLCTIPAIMIHTKSYGAAFGLTCAFAAIYAAAVFALYIVPWATWGAAIAVNWAVCGFWNHLMSTCHDAAASANGYAETV